MADIIDHFIVLCAARLQHQVMESFFVVDHIIVIPFGSPTLTPDKNRQWRRRRNTQNLVNQLYVHRIDIDVKSFSGCSRHIDK